MLEINSGLILWTILTFVIVLIILRKAAWKPLLGALAARELGGALLAASEGSGKGATFTLELPAQQRKLPT